MVCYTQLIMSAKPCRHTDSLWKESERKRGRRESWQVYRCIVSATQWCRERRIETPTRNRLEGGVYFDKLYVILSVLRHIVLTLSPLVLCPLSFLKFLSVPHLAPQSFNTPTLSFLAGSLLIFSPCRHFSHRCQSRCLVYWCDKSSGPFISCHLCYR